MKKKVVETPRGLVEERRHTPPPKVTVSAAKGAGTAAMALAGVILPTVLMFLMDPANVKAVLADLPIPPAYVALLISLVTGLAKFSWDYISRKVKAASSAPQGE